MKEGFALDGLIALLNNLQFCQLSATRSIVLLLKKDYFMIRYLSITCVGLVLCTGFGVASSDEGTSHDTDKEMFLNTSEDLVSFDVSSCDSDVTPYSARPLTGYEPDSSDDDLDLGYRCPPEVLKDFHFTISSYYTTGKDALEMAQLALEQSRFSVARTLFEQAIAQFESFHDPEKESKERAKLIEEAYKELNKLSKNPSRFKALMWNFK